MVAEEVIPPLLSVEEANAPDEPNSDCIEKQEEQMGIFQTLDRLEEAIDALLNTKSSASSSTLQHHLEVKNMFPCGEGAGYAGGIVSAAIDGERVIDAIAALIP